MAARLSISNSKKALPFLIMVLGAILSVVIVEIFYAKNNVPYYIGKNHEQLVSQALKSKKSTLFILGDSRAEAGIIPELIDLNSTYDAFNIGISGVYNGYYNKLKIKQLTPSKVLVAVSPYSVFNNFKLKKTDWKEHTRVLRKPNEFTEKYLSSWVNRNSHLHYGAQGLLDVLKYKKVSDYYSPKGWHGYDRLGSDEKYTNMLNLNAYKHNIIEEYKDSIKLDLGKTNFENLVKDFGNENIEAVFIRMPISKEIRAIEDEKYPWFSDYIKSTVEKNNFEFHDFESFDYPENEVDGSHLNRKSAKEFTTQIIKKISK